MKKFSIVSILLMASMVLASIVSAQSNLPGSGWWSGEQVQNVGTGDATIIVTAYDASSTNTYTAQAVVTPGAAKTFVPSEFTGMPDGFQGSAVVSSNEPIKAIVNVTNRQSGALGVAGGLGAAQYQGIDGSAVATTLYFPLVKGDSFGKTTTFYIQNAGTAAATATATFRMRNGDTHTLTTPSIGPNQMVIFAVQDTTTYGTPTVNDAKVGGLVVTSAQPLAGVVLEHFTTEDPATILQGTRGFTNADFDTTAYAPVIKNARFGRFTGLQVQNVDTVPISVTVTYLKSAGTCPGPTYTDTRTNVAPNASVTIAHFDATTTNLPADCVASATVVGTGNIVAIVNESFRSDYLAANPTLDQRAVTSSAIPDSSATSNLSIPLFKDDRFNKRTGLQIQNVSGAQITDLVATFSCTGAATFTAVSQPQTVANGAAFLFFTPSDDAIFVAGSPFSSSNVNCAVSATAGGNIVAIANESVDNTGLLSQDNNNYEGFNLP